MSALKILPLVAAATALKPIKAVEQVQRDQQERARGEAGPAGPAGRDGKDGQDGRDGIGIVAAQVDAAGDLILTLTDATTLNAGRVRGRDGRTGRPGASAGGLGSSEVQALIQGALEGQSMQFDDYADSEQLPVQTAGVGGQVLTFTFAEGAVHLVVIHATGLEAQFAYADHSGGTPADGAGRPVEHNTPSYLPVTCATIKVWAPQAMRVYCEGYRR